jgi:nitroreductase
MPITTTDLMTVLRQRRSFGLRDVLPDPIDLGDVGLILEAANWAPSHGHTEPWRFTVYSGAARRGLGAAFVAAAQGDPKAEEKQRDKVWMAPVWISIGMLPSTRNPEWEEMIAVGCAIQNAQLMASQLGLATKWSSGAIGTHDLVAEFVGLKPPARLLGFLYVGRPAGEWPASTRRPLAEKVRWVSE